MIRQNLDNNWREDVVPFPEVTLGSDEPLYNIGVVARMTGISMATLRAWERRYNFPESERTAGGHRLYSERDVMRLRWVKERTDEGMQTAQAIQALRLQEQTGRLSLVEQAPQPAVMEPKPSTTAPHLSLLLERLYRALQERDLAKADQLLGEAFAVATPEEIILEVIGPAMAQIGDAWQDGKFSVATEHLATNYLRQRLLMWMVNSPPPRQVSPILLACGPNEWHEGGLLVLGALLRRRRWPIAYLGQSVPLPDLAEFVRQIRPALVVLVAMTENTAAELVEWPQHMPEVAQRGTPIVAYAGRVFMLQPEWRLRMAGIYLGDHFQEGIVTIERLLTAG